MGELDRAAAAMKKQAGLPIDGKPVAAPSPAPSAQTNLQVPAATPPQPSPQRTPEEIIAHKEQTIVDQSARIKALEESQEKGMNSMMQMLDAKLNPKEPPKPPELPALPNNLDTLPAKEQIQIIAKHEAAQMIQSEREQEREAIMQTIGPILQRAKGAIEVTDKQAVMERYGQFDYPTLKPVMDELEKELPGSSVLERAAMAAQRTGNEVMLLPASPQAPVSQPAVPSMQAAASVLGLSQAPQTGPTYEQKWGEAAKLGMQRKTVEQGVYIDSLLKEKVNLPSMRG